MTREEAINIMKVIVHMLEEKYDTDRVEEAVDMAIKALEQEPKYCDRNICLKNECNGIGCDECEVTKSQEPCEDCISRAEAIDALGYDISIESDEGLDAYRTVIKEMLCKIYDVQKENIEKLPSIQPKSKTGHSEHKYNFAYSKGFEAGKKQAFTEYCMQCYDELSPYEQVKLMVEWGADIPSHIEPDNCGNYVVMQQKGRK